VNPPPLPVRKRFPWIFYWVVLVLIAIVAFAPVGSVVACGLIANTHGCRADEGSVHPCVIGGKDYGELLYTLGVMGLAYANHPSRRRIGFRDHCQPGKVTGMKKMGVHGLAPCASMNNKHDQPRSNF
jgi:hypothetical protein